MYSSKELRELLPLFLESRADIRPPPGISLASVLVPVLVSTPDPRMVFTRRTQSLSRHAGEISFPGGLVDEGEAPAVAALREAEEELGLARADVELLGSLPPVHTRVSGIVIVPFVGLLAKDPRFVPNADEIDEILEFRLADLIARGAESAFEHEGVSFQTYVYDLDGRVIWGATARILWSFIELLHAQGSKGVVRPA